MVVHRAKIKMSMSNFDTSRAKQAPIIIPETDKGRVRRRAARTHIPNEEDIPKFYDILRKFRVFFKVGSALF